MPSVAGLRRLIAAALFGFATWRADRTILKSRRLQERAERQAAFSRNYREVAEEARAWGEQTEPQTRS